MKVRIEKQDKEVELEFNGSGRDLMQQLDVNPESCIVVRNGEIVTDDVQLENSDTVEFVSVVSGG